MKPSIDNNASARTRHDQVRLLLPWYVNATLPKDERRLVEEHCQICALCKAERTEMQMLSEYNRQIAVPGLPATASFNRLMARIESESQTSRINTARPHYLTGLLAAISSWANFLPPFPLAAALVLLLLFAPAAMLLRPVVPEVPEAAYRTLSNPHSLDNFGVNDIRVIFAENMGTDERTRLLASVHGEVVSGPSLRGLYLIRIGAPPDASPDIAKAITALRREAGVLFAEPALPTGDATPVSDAQT